MDHSDILRRSREAAQRLSSFGKRETERLRGLGIPVQPHTDHASFLTLPGNISDVDLAIPHSGNLPELQKKLETAGIPFRRMHGENAVHSYTTPDGIWVDVGIRPQRELDYINRGLEGLAKLSPEQKEQLLLEKYRMHASGDAAAYKKWKQDFYESHNIFPPGGDFSKVSAEKTAAVPREVKDLRRALTLKATGSHDFHQTEARHLPAIIENGVTPAPGHLGTAAYFGAGAPAKGYEPSAHMPAVAVSRGSPDVQNYAHPRHGADTYALYRETVPLKAKDYVVLHPEALGQKPAAYAELLERLRAKRLRVLPSDVINRVFRPGKSLPEVDELAAYDLERGLKKVSEEAGKVGPHTWTGPDGTVYDVKKLWELTKDNPIEQVDIAPYVGRRTIKLRHKELGPAHEQRVQDADLTVPLLISHLNSRVDGNHRLAKALRQGLKQLPARRLTEEQLMQGKLAALQTYGVKTAVAGA